MIDKYDNKMLPFYVTKKTRKKTIKNVQKLITVGVSPSTAFLICGYNGDEARAFGLAAMERWQELETKAKQQITTAETGAVFNESGDKRIDVRVSVGDDGIIKKDISQSIISILEKEEEAQKSGT